MRLNIVFITCVLFALALLKCKTPDIKSESIGFLDPTKDLLLAHYDCKTDVDDLHSVAAFATLLAQDGFSKINYHVVAGTYGIQEGLYVPAEKLFGLAFPDHWSDAHNNPVKTLAKVRIMTKETIENKGDIWIAEAGQSDFSAKLIAAIHSDFPQLDLSTRIHVVQHSDWNEKVTSPSSLDFLKTSIDYQKIPDGNIVGNGTPGFQSANYEEWKEKLKNQKTTKIWNLAQELAHRFNGVEGRYLNETIEAGGLDFSDTAEICWILGLNDIKDSKEFFNRFGGIRKTN